MITAAWSALKKTGCFFTVCFLAVPSTSPAASTDAWVRRASNAVQEIAKGNTTGAVNNAVPGASYRLPETQTRVYAVPSGRVGVAQPIAPAGNLSSRYLKFNSSYNAGASFNASGQPRISHGVNLTGQNRFFRNTTTVTPGIPNFNNKDNQ